MSVNFLFKTRVNIIFISIKNLNQNEEINKKSFSHQVFCLHLLISIGKKNLLLHTQTFFNIKFDDFSAEKLIVRQRPTQ